MGFDIFALNPKTKNEEHSYFRANVWYWRPIWSFVETVCQEEISKLDEDVGLYNDGCEVPDSIAIDIGNKLNRTLENGTFNKFQIDFENEQKEVSDEVSYKCDYDLTKSFADFCINSGGFSIC